MKEVQPRIMMQLWVNKGLWSRPMSNISITTNMHNRSSQALRFRAEPLVAKAFVAGMMIEQLFHVRRSSSL
jgi:hypothetical protein